MAERAAWDFVEKLPPEEKFELVTINPSAIFGPQICADTGFTSGELIKMIMNGVFPAIPRLCIGFVDVREVA